MSMMLEEVEMKAILWFLLALVAAGIACELDDEPQRVEGVTGDASSAEASEAARELAKRIEGAGE